MTDLLFYQTLWLGMALGFPIGVCFGVILIPLVHSYRNDLPRLRGKDLTKAAHGFGVERKWLESDRSLRKRALAHLKGRHEQEKKKWFKNT